MPDTHNSENSTIIDTKWRILLMSTRQALLMIVIAIEKFLGIEKNKHELPDN